MDRARGVVGGMAGEIFISYRRADQAKARLLHALLKQRGVDAWYDALLGAGDDWRHKTASALEAAPIFVLLFSKVASESDDISKELAAATFSKKLVIPVRIENIKPSGAFLYELASRNWVDAYEDTEAKFADLADKLAALVKGGPEAEVAAFNLGAPTPPPVVKPAANPLLRKPAAIGIAALALAVTAGLAFLMTRPAGGSAQADSYRVAFFGFTAGDEDAASVSIARTATDETFANFSIRRVDVAARDDATGPQKSPRLDRAGELGASYALSADVRREGEKVVTSMRLEHVPSRTTLWETSIDGDPSRPAVTAIEVSDRAVQTTNCMTTAAYSDESGPFKPEVLSIIASACGALGMDRGGGNQQLWRPKYLAELSELARFYPDNGAIHAQIASFAALRASGSGDTATGLLKQAEDALGRAEKLDPDGFATALARSNVALSKGSPPADWLPGLEKALQRKPKTGEAVPFAQASHRLGLSLLTVGRIEGAQSYFSQAAGADPLQSYPGYYFAMTMAERGLWEAEGQFDHVMQKRVTAHGWELAVIASVFRGIGDFDKLAALRPAAVPEEVVRCYADLRTSLKATSQAVRLAGFRKAAVCLEAFDSPHALMQAASLLGDLDAAFEIVNDPARVALFMRAYNNPWFLPATRAMRADPRFLPLMEKHGFVDYWKQTKTKPDVCATIEERDIPLCVALRASP